MIPLRILRRLDFTSWADVSQALQFMQRATQDALRQAYSSFTSLRGESPIIVTGTDDARVVGVDPAALTSITVFTLASGEGVSLTSSGDTLIIAAQSPRAYSSDGLELFEYTTRRVLWFAAAVDTQTVVLTEDEWFGDGQQGALSGTYYEETAYVEVEVVWMNGGLLGGAGERRRWGFGGLLRKGNSGSGLNWEIDQNLLQISGLDLPSTPPVYGAIALTMALSGTHNGTITISYSATFSTATSGPTITKIRILGGGKFDPP